MKILITNEIDLSLTLISCISSMIYSKKDEKLCINCSDGNTFIISDIDNYESDMIIKNMYKNDIADLSVVFKGRWQKY